MSNKVEKVYYISGPPLQPLDPRISVADELFSALKNNNGDDVAQREAETGRELTYRQLRKDSLSLAQGLRAEGVGEGTVVSVVTFNSQEAQLFVLSSILVGATVAPLDSALTVDEIGHFIKLIKPQIIFAEGDETINKIEQVSKLLTYAPKIVVIDAQKHSHTCFQDLKQAECADFKPDIKNAEDHVLFILPTSGTTGLPKGVMMSDLYIRNLAFPLPENVHLSILTSSPLFWVTGIITLISGIISEFTITYLRRPAKENTLLSLIQEYKIDLWVTAPTALQGIVMMPNRNTYDFTSLKMIFVGGACLSTQSILRIQDEVFHNKVPIMQAYGMTEVGIISSSKDGFNKVGATGLLAKGCKCKIENLETGEFLGPGKKGEICVKVPYLMKGYVNNPEATAALLDKDGWVHTGDIGYYDEEGYLFVIDRIKELIKYKSYHISPTELEDILRKHPAVKDAVVVGVPHPTDGDHASAFVISNKPVTEHELVQYVAERVSETKQLRGGVRFVQEIPYTPTGKPKRKVLRDQLIENTSNEIW